MDIGYDKRYERHAGLVDLKKLVSAKILIIGLGSLGSWALVNLLKIGIRYIKAYDFDKVDIENFSNQIFSHQDAGQLKTEVMAEIAKEYTQGDDDCKIVMVNEKFIGGFVKQNIIVSAVDNMETRSILWKTAKDSINCELFLDARMAGPFIQLFCVDMSDTEQVKWFESPDWEFLYDDSEAEPLKCTEKSIIHASQMCAAHYSAAIVAWANGKLLDYPRLQQFDLTWSGRPVFEWREGAKCLAILQNASSS